MSASKTFERLNENKRHAFLEAAFKEFALKGYEAASITNLVKELGIAKGSVYQYFDDKNDLYDHLISTAYRTFDRLTKQACPQELNESYSDWLLKYLLVQLKLQLSFPHYALLLLRIDVPTHEMEEVHGTIRKEWEELPWRFLPIVNKPNQLLKSQLGSASRSLFKNVLDQEGIVLTTIVNNSEEIDIPGETLLNFCSSWVRLLSDEIQLD